MPGITFDYALIWKRAARRRGVVGPSSHTATGSHVLVVKNDSSLKLDEPSLQKRRSQYSQ